jgi:hypothetical protein
MAKIKSDKINYVMDQQESEKMIKKAENGPFHSMKAVKNELAKWKAKYSK